MKILSCVVLSFALAYPAFASVSVISPASGTVSPTVNYVASATSSACPRGVSSMGIYVDNSLRYVVPGANLNSSLNLTAGYHHTVVQEWDYCGGASLATVDLTVTNNSGVVVVSPLSKETVSTTPIFTASATSPCAQGVGAMGVYVDNTLYFVTPGSSLNTQLTLPVGDHYAVVQSWDNCGGYSQYPMHISVADVGVTTLSNIQASGGWNQWGELAPVYDICTASQCPGVNWSTQQHVHSPSLSGDATQLNLGGTTPYSDVLYSNPLIGQGSTRGMPDTNHTLLPTLHHLTYDTQVFVTNFAVTQDLEFDVNLYMGGVGMEWGMQCNHLDHKVWDIWDNVNVKWIPTSVPCLLNEGVWNRITIQVQRQSNNDLLYQTLTVNGTTYPINQTVPPFTVPSSWYGMTVNYQMDGDYAQHSNTTYLDRLNISYW